jgi:choline dehydrogenase-like flavoprotein
MPDGAGIPLENPATGETIATVPELGAEEVRGLVGDASAFPSASGTNPMATIMALARRTAHAIAAA